MTITTATEHSTVSVCELAGVTYRRLDYWANGVLVPSINEAQGSGYRRNYSTDDVNIAIVLRTVTDYTGQLPTQVLTKIARGMRGILIGGVPDYVIIVWSKGDIIITTETPAYGVPHLVIYPSLIKDDHDQAEGV